MNNSQNDTSSKFHSNIDKLVKLINVSLEKEQTNNAEKYLNYFFVVMVRYYEKSSKASKVIPESGPVTKITSGVKPDSTAINDIETSFPERSIDHVIGDPFTEKILKILSEHIKTGGFKIFHFVLSKLKDSIRILIKEKETYDKAGILLRQFKFILDQIYNKHDRLSSFEKNWFLSETYYWFTELYSGSVNTIDDVSLFEGEILQILKYYIDNNRVDLYEKFLEHLSSTIFSYTFKREKIINNYKQKITSHYLDYEILINNYRRELKKIKSTYDFKESLKDLEVEIRTEFRRFSLSEKDILDFTEEFFKVLLDDFKETYLRVILIKTIVYSIFKKNYSFFEKYLTYNQPSDSDAVWASRYYGIQSLNEAIRVLIYGERIILNDWLFFSMGHHGFSIYLNTYIAYYIMTADETSVIREINGIRDYNESVILKHGLENVKRRNNLFEVNILGKTFNSDFINTKLDRYIREAEKRVSSLDLQTTREADISLEVVENFKNIFINQFYKTATLRSVLNYYGFIKYSNEATNENGLGINQLLPKKAFMKESDVLFFNLHDTLADGLAENESFSILNQVEQFCEKKKFTQVEFETFLTDNKDKYDLIISKGRYIVTADFINLNFKESWALESELNNLPGFLGLLESHYNIFLVRNPSKEGYLLLNSKNCVYLNQLIPPDFANAERVDIFNFSLIDFKNDPYSLELHTKEAHSQTELLKSVWLRIFEKFRVEVSDSFIGVDVELI